MVSEFLQMAVHFEECRKKWLLAGDELVSCKEMLAKAETERGALEVRLKHARNQVDVEIRRRQKAEAVHEKLVGLLDTFEEICMKICLSQSTCCCVGPAGAAAAADPGSPGF